MTRVKFMFTTTAILGLVGLALAQSTTPPTPAKPTQPPTSKPPVATTHTNVDSEIRQRVEAFAAAWNKHDATAMASFWTATGDLINPFGRTAKGRDEVLKLFQDEHNGFAKNSTFTLTNQSVRTIKPDVAILDIDSTITGITTPEGSAEPPLKHHVTLVLAKEANQWMFVAVRPVIYAPKPGEHAMTR
jgi:uncharacterized protein (TIGR02246 family)